MRKDGGKSVTKSMVRPSQGLVGGSIGMFTPCFRCLGALIRWQSSPAKTYLRTDCSNFGQKKSLETSSAVLAIPKWPDSGESWKSRMILACRAASLGIDILPFCVNTPGLTVELQSWTSLGSAFCAA